MIAPAPSLMTPDDAEVMATAAIFTGHGAVELDWLRSHISRTLVRHATAQIEKHGRAEVAPALKAVAADQELTPADFGHVCNELKDAIEILTPSRYAEAVGVLQDRFRRNELRAGLDRIEDLRQRENVDDDDLVADIEDLIAEQRNLAGTTTSTSTLSDGLESALSETAAVIPSGFVPFDDAQPEGAAELGWMLMFTAPPKVGKSALLLFLILLMLSKNDGLKVLWCRGEMSRRTMQLRALSMLSGLTRTVLRWPDGQPSPLQVEAKTKGLERFRKVAPRFHDLPSPFSVADIEAAIVQTGAEVCVIDYLQKIIPADGGRSQLEDLDRISHELSQLATRRNVLMLVVSNMSGHAANTLPGLASMFKGSSTIGFDCDAGYLGRLDQDAQDALDRGDDLPERYQIDWLCRGHRHGDGKSFSVMFNRFNQRFFPVGADR